MLHSAAAEAVSDLFLAPTTLRTSRRSTSPEGPPWLPFWLPASRGNDESPGQLVNLTSLTRAFPVSG